MGQLIVAAEVIDRLAANPGASFRLVAGCVERCAGLFTGVVGGDPARQADVSRYVDLVDALWDADAPQQVFASGIVFIDQLDEMSSDDEIVETDRTAAVLAAIAVRHALESRASSEIDAALRCAHVCLTLAGLFRDDAGPSWYDDENRFQLEDATERGDLGAVRSTYQEIGRARLALVLGSP